MSRDYTKLNNDQKHAVGAFTAAAELVRRTGQDVNPDGHGRRWRLLIASFKVQVFVRTTADGDWQVSDYRRPLADDTNAVILVDLAQEPPEFYVMTADWYKDDIARRYAERHKSARPNPKATHWAVSVSHVVRWYDRWELFDR